MNEDDVSKLINTEIYIKKNKYNNYLYFLNAIFIVFNLILSSIILYSVIELSNNAKVLFNSSLITDIDKINRIINFVCENVLPDKC